MIILCCALKRVGWACATSIHLGYAVVTEYIVRLNSDKFSQVANIYSNVPHVLQLCNARLNKR